jgi:VWFA-related protein
MTTAGLLCLLAASAAAPRFASEAQWVRIDVAATIDGVPIQGLEADDFELLDDGAPEPVILLSRAESQAHAVLVLDQSESLDQEDRRVLKTAATELLDRLEPTDRATLLTFTHDLTLVSGPETPATVRESLAGLDGGGTTALYDAIHAGLTLGAAAPGRPFVVVLTDGNDRISWITGPQVWQAARRCETTLYFVSRASWPENPSILSPSPAIDGQGQAFLRTLAEETGGRVWAGSGASLEEQFRRVVAEVKSRYVLAFDAGDRKPGWHKLEVRLKNHPGGVRTRRGYFVAPREPGPQQ